MSVYQLDISWAATTNERRQLRWELIACERVLGVVLTAREDSVAVLFAGDCVGFRTWAKALEPGPREAVS
jgi:hypothetical protein